MSLLKRRPKVQVYTPAELVPGQRFEAQLTLEATKPVRLAWLDLSLNGRVSSGAGAGNHPSWEDDPLMYRRVRLCADYDLPVGQSRFSAQFLLLDWLPPSYSGRAASVDYTLDVHGSIPWWPDLRRSFSLRVVRPLEGEVPVRPGLYSSDPDGPRGVEPHAEVSLGSTVLAVGDELRGAIALGNVDHAGYTGLSVAFVGSEIVRRAGATLELGLDPYELALPLHRLREGESVPFRTRVPALTPSFEAPSLRLAWALEVRARRGLRADLALRVPLVILPGRRGSSAPAPDRRAPPTVGSDRVSVVWDAVAQQTGLERQGEELLGSIGEVSIRVRRVQSRRSGFRLVAELRFPSLGLGLDGGARDSFRRLFGGPSIPLGESEWDAKHYLTGRDAGQVASFAKVVRVALARCRVADLSDVLFTLEAPSAGLRGEQVHELVVAAQRLARAIPAARAAIIPPAGFEREPWERLSRFVAGSLDVARMSVSGQLEGHAVSVETHWDAHSATATTLRLEPRSPLATKHAGRLSSVDGVLLRQGEGEAESKAAELGAEAKPIVVELVRAGRQLIVAPDSLSLFFPTPALDPAEIFQVLPELARLAELLAARRGAYR